MTRGVCLCGTVEYEVTAPFNMMVHCHCSMCRKHHGAAFATFAAAPYDAFRWLAGEDSIDDYRSSEQGTRSFCRRCGSVTPMLMAEQGFAIVPAGNLIDDPGIRPQMHIFVGSKAPWYTINDTLPQHAGFPPEFGGGSGIARPSVMPRPGIAEGSCLCGDVAYEYSEPQRAFNCYCSRCQRGRSAAHTTNVFVNTDNFRWLRGESLVTDYKVPEARFFGTAFCSRCGGEAPRISRERGVAVIPAGALDTEPGIMPEASIFVGSKASWIEIGDDLPQFQEMPS